MNSSWQITGALFGLLLLVGAILAVSKIARLTNAAYHAGRAPALARAGHLDEAIAESRLAVRLVPSDAHAYDCLGQILSHTDWQQVAANGSAEASAEAQRMLSQPSP